MPSRKKLTIVPGMKTPPNTRLTIGNFIADILIDGRRYATLYHWIVQRIGSAEILYWGQEHSFEDAEIAAKQCLVSLSNRDTKGA